MKYALLIYENDAAYGPQKDGAALAGIIGRHMQFGQDLGSRMAGGAGLKGVTTATTVRTSAGAQAVHDGPFAETKEQLGGFYLIDVPDLDAAIAIARQVPLLADGAVEIRPVLGPA